MLFGLRAIAVADALPRRPAAWSIGSQLLRAATSVGANYRAACRARSQAEFIAKMGIVEEEADEAVYWLECLVRSNLMPRSRLQDLIQEGNEILAIVVASINTSRGHRRPHNRRQSAIRDSQTAMPLSSRKA